MVSIDLGVWHSRFLIVFQSANDSSLIVHSSRYALESWRLSSLNHNRSIESCSLEFAGSRCSGRNSRRKHDIESSIEMNSSGV